MSAADQQVLAAWVSAIAAVVQAIAAGLAIWYSGKLARDSAAREKAADEANARRLEEVNAAATEQRRLDHLAAEDQRAEAEARAFNEPINLALGFSERAAREMERERDEMQARAQAHRGENWGIDRGRERDLAMAQLPVLIRGAKNAPTASAMAGVLRTLPPLGGLHTAIDWIPQLNRQLEAVSAAIDGLREQLMPE